MAEQFGRRASAIITNLNTNKAIVVEGLRIEFDVEKTPKAADSKAKVKIYNLSRDSRDLIQAEELDGNGRTVIELSVGYQQTELKLLFRGRGNVVSIFKAPNWVTEIDATDGGVAMRSAVFERKYPAGTRVADIAVDIAQAAGLPSQIIQNVEGAIPKARAFSGSALNNIEDLQATYGFQFDIQDEQVIIRPEAQQTRQIYRITLDRATGLLNAPRTKGSIVEAEALLNVDLAPNAFVNLQTLVPNLSGEYLVQKATYKGDTWSGNWVVTVEMTKTEVNAAFKSLRTLEGELP